MNVLFALLRAIPLVWYLVAALVLFGGVKELEVREMHAEQLQAQVAAQKAATLASEKARAKEQEAALALGAINDIFQQAERARAAERLASADRLRKLAAQYQASSPAAAACSSLEVPAVAVIPDATRENLERLAADADEVSDSLRACQAYVGNVVRVIVTP